VSKTIPLSRAIGGPPYSSSLATELRRALRRPQFWCGLAILVPTFLWYAAFAYLPIARGLWLAVVDYDFLTHSSSGFVGLDNFRKLLLDPLLVVALRNTAILAVVQFMVMIPLGLLVATCLVNLRRGMQGYQAAIFLPVVVSLVAISLLFRFLMDPDVGIFNTVLSALGLPTSKWLSSPDSALFTLAGIDVWKSLGFTTVLLTAGMLNIPAELYDAARVDGVNEWQRFWHLTLPLLGHTLVMVMVLYAISSLQVYTSVYVMTGGGPGNATYVFNLLIVQQAFNNFRFGVAAAAAFIQLAIICLITFIQLKLITPKWSY
jgi:multiple sugar transport system permease protein